jgi:gentisate 1,2-dioxygenase
MTTSRGTKSEPAQDYDGRVAAASLVPLWTFFKDWFAPEPSGSAIPHVWHFDELRPLIVQSAEVVSTEDAERRVLVLENPGLPGRHLATDSLYAGVQLIMPGEFARAHRHTAAALRFIIEGSGSYTAVAGERCYMEPGDFIVTPSWAWHEHRNEGTTPTLWLDVLDVALLRFLGAGFSEHYSSREFPAQAPPGDSRYRYGRNLLPAGYRREPGASPLFSYPYSHARETLERLRQQGAWDPCHGLKMQYIDPTTGGPAIPTISTFLQLLPRGFATEPYTTTAGSIVAVISGAGRAFVGRDAGRRELRFGPRDLFILPGWQPSTLQADEDTVLFSASDEAVQRALGVWRERRGSPG